MEAYEKEVAALLANPARYAAERNTTVPKALQDLAEVGRQVGEPIRDVLRRLSTPEQHERLLSFLQPQPR